jgi:hypothetical protein
LASKKVAKVPQLQRQAQHKLQHKPQRKLQRQLDDNTNCKQCCQLTAAVVLQQAQAGFGCNRLLVCSSVQDTVMLGMLLCTIEPECMIVQQA